MISDFPQMFSASNNVTQVQDKTSKGFQAVYDLQEVKKNSFESGSLQTRKLAVSSAEDIYFI